MKLNFAFEGAPAEFAEDGQYDMPVESTLPHRFTLTNGLVVDKYDGVSDDQVKILDHEEATRVALENLDLDGNPAPLDVPPALGVTTPEGVVPAVDGATA